MIIKIVRQKYFSDPKTRTEYWLVTGPARASTRSHPVQRCTKTGKLFKDTNGYSTLFVEKLLAAKVLSGPQYGGTEYSKTYSIERAPGVQPIQKVNNEKAIQVTRLKNRINYLEGRIANDAKRLAVAKQELANLS